MVTMTAQRTPTALIILDGWGYREEAANNALHHAQTPFWDKIWRERPHTLIQTSGLSVGLPEGQMGNSEVGHMNLGAGRVVYQSLTRIDKDMADGTFAQNPVITDAIDQAIRQDKAIHIFGLLSSGGVHSHEEHLFQAIRIAAARSAKRIFLHAFLDGRDTPPRSAEPSLQKADAVFAEVGVGRTASVV